jgi:hypothetical protein
VSSNLPDWRKVARQRMREQERQRKAWPMEDLLLECVVEGDMDAARQLDHLLRDRREKAHADRGSGGKKSGDERNLYNEKRVLAALAEMKKHDKLPPTRNLVRKLTDDFGIGRNPATAALKRLAEKGELYEQYIAHFS